MNHRPSAAVRGLDFDQLARGFSPLATGLAFLPMTGAIALTSINVQTRVMPHTGAKPLVTVGMTLGMIATLGFIRNGFSVPAGFCVTA